MNKKARYSVWAIKQIMKIIGYIFQISETVLFILVDWKKQSSHIHVKRVEMKEDTFE